MDKLNYKFLSFSELSNLTLHKVNRCGYTSLEDAINNGFTETDYNKFISRCKITLKDIKKNGYLETSMLIIAKCKDDGLLYLIEGQGRRGAIIIGKEKNEIDVDNVPCLIYEDELTYREIGEKIRIHNTKKSNRWACADISKSGARELGGDYEWAYNFVEQYKLRTNCCPYMANLMVYGEKHSHKRNSSLPFTQCDFREGHDLFMSLYEKFLDEFGEKQNIKTSTRHAKVKRADLGIMFNSFFSFLYRTCKKHSIDENVYLNRILDKMCAWSNKIDVLNVQNFLEVVNLGKTDKMQFYQKINIEKIFREVLPKELFECFSGEGRNWAFETNYKKVA